MRRFNVTGCALIFFALTGAQAQVIYTVKDLGTLGGIASAGNALNQNDQVTGDAQLENDQSRNAFISGFNGALPLRDLGTFGGATSVGQSINSNGEVAGIAELEDGSRRAFLSGPNGGPLADLGTLGGLHSYGTGVNGAGQVTGYSYTDTGAQHAFFRATGAPTLSDLGTLGGALSFGNGVNASGQVAGYSTAEDGFSHAFLSDSNGGALHDLGTLGGRFSIANAVNDAGQVVGRSELSSIGTHAFRSAPNGGPLFDLGTLGGSSSEARGINSAGTVVGNSNFAAGNVTLHAFLYTTNLGMVDLNNLIAPGSGWVLNEARAINDQGRITGVGSIGVIIDGQQATQQHAFLLIPIPPAVQNISIKRLEDGHMVIEADATPLQTYTLKATTDLTMEFQTVTTIVAPNDGKLRFEDAFASTFSRRFYRFVYP